MSAAVLDVRGLAVSYRGAGIGVQGVSLLVSHGEVVTLLGPNGAGKTSALRGIAGLLRRDVAYRSAGSVFLSGRDVTKVGPIGRARRRLCLVPEQNKVFSELTVRENLELARVISDRAAYASNLDRSLSIFPALGELLGKQAGYCSGGQRQMLALAMALCAGPQVLIVDELTLGLSPGLVDSMVTALKEIAAGGLPILMAEQNVNVALELSHVMHVLDGGRVVASGEPQQLAARADIADVYLGRRSP